MASLAEASVRIRPDTRGFGTELTRQVDKDADRAGKKAGKTVGHGVGVGLGSALAAAGIAKLLKGSIDEAVDFVESASKVKQIFKENAEEIKHFAHEAADGMGQSTVQALDAASKFGIFGQAANLTGEELVAFSIQMATLASDLASFNNTSPEDAINAIGSALAGQNRPMRTYGVLLDKANIAAHALGIGLVKSTGDVDAIGLAQDRATLAARNYQAALHKHGPTSRITAQALIAQTAAQQRLTKAVGGTIPALTQEQRILATQSLILEQTKIQQGDFTRTKHLAANQSRILTAETENLKEAIGLGLLPALISTQRIVLAVIHAYQEHSHTLGTATVALFAFAATLWAVNAAMGAWETLTLIAQGLQLRSIGLWIWYSAGLTYAAVASGLATVGTWLLVAGVTALNVAITILTSPITLIVVAIVALVAGLIYAYKHSDRFRAIVDAVWKAIKIAVKATVDWLVGTAWPFIQRVWDGIAAGATWLYRSVILPVFRLIQFAGRVLGTVLYNVFKLISWVITQIVAPVFRWIWEHVVGPAIRAIGAVVSWLWTERIRPAFTLIAALARWLAGKARAEFNVIAALARWLWENAIGPAFRGISRVVTTTWNLMKIIFNAMVGFVRNVLVPAFREGMKRIGDAWASLKELAKKPVNFILGTVINKGIIDGINKVTGFFGKSAGLKHVPTLALGGVVPGKPSPVDNTLAMVASGEYVMPTDKTRRYLPLLEQMRRGDLRGYIGGGIIGAITNPVGYVRDRLNLGGITSRFGNNIFVQTLVKAVQSVIGRMTEWFKSKLFGGPGSVGGGAVMLGGGGVGGSPIQAIVALAQRFYPGAFLTSGYRPGANDYHGSGRAADISGGGYAGMARVAQGFYALSGRLLELIHEPSWYVKNGRRVGAGYYASVIGGGPGREHHSHVHVAANPGALNFDRGGVLDPGWNTIFNGTGGREHLTPYGSDGPLVEAGAITLHVHGDLAPAVLPQVRSMLDDALRAVVVEVRKGVRR